MLINDDIRIFLFKNKKPDSLRISEINEILKEKSEPKNDLESNEQLEKSAQKAEKKANQKVLVEQMSATLAEKNGITTYSEAQSFADKLEKDLVLIAPQGVPPVCRIMDYGKFRFEQSKREKEQRKNQKIAELKELRMWLNIDENDMKVKAASANKFLKEGDKVKITIRFRGREMTHKDLGYQLAEKFKALCAENGTAEGGAKLEGRNYSLIISPNNAGKHKS